jgi:hypothetical protein
MDDDLWDCLRAQDLYYLNTDYRSILIDIEVH